MTEVDRTKDQGFFRKEVVQLADEWGKIYLDYLGQVILVLGIR